MSLILRPVLVLLLLPVMASATDPYVPAQLEDWRGWVLEGREYRNCPFRFDGQANQRNEFVCAWPGELELAVDAVSGRFLQQWTVYADMQWVGLPGDTNYWPHQVTANGRAIEVVLRDNVPSVYLAPGNYRMTGSFEWDERPGVLSLPARVGLVSLRVNGAAVERPERTRAGIFLGERKRETETRDAVSIKVYRLVIDDVPTRLTTRLQIDVAGSVREELFGPLLPQGFVPLAIASQLPARLEPDGKLRLQVRPGRWVITLTARGPGVLDAVELPDPEINLPDSEIWSYRSLDTLRVTAAEGLPPIDPAQADVPERWQQLPAFLIEPGESLAINERSRGIVSAENELILRRQMWLDFDGTGFAVNDDVGGTMRTDWRLDMTPPYAVLSAQHGNQNLLITNGPQEGQTGVELRRSDVDLDALGRADTRGELPVTGWDTRFAGVSAVLHLPPGHKLLAAPGTDNAPGSWASRWQLLDFFLVLIITIASWRLFGRTAGVIALAALVLSFHEMNAPAWLWLNVLVAIALLRVAPAGRLRQSVSTYQAVSALLLLFALVPFIASQLRVAIYPQLEPQYGVPGPARSATLQLERQQLLPEERKVGLARNRLEGEADRLARDSLDEFAVIAEKRAMPAKEVPAAVSGLGGDAIDSAGIMNVFDLQQNVPGLIVQTGPGMPSWRWNSYQLGWSGPVDADQTMRLMILPRWAVTILRFAEVIMLLLFSAVLAAEILKRRFTLPGGLKIGNANAGMWLAAGLLTLMLSAGPDAQAQTPDAELLRELEKRLLEPPECTPRCAEIVAADVDIDTVRVRMSLSVHALEDIAVPLPGSERGWRPTAILIDGTAASQVMRGPDQALWARLAAGRHTITMSGPAPSTDSIEIPFPSQPRVIEVESDGWFIAGVKDRRLLSGSLQLTRLQQDGDGDSTARWESSRFPVFVDVMRTVHLGLDWRVVTMVQRVAPVQGALTLEIPLLDDESVMTSGITVEDGRALVSMRPDQRTVSWSSSVPLREMMTLAAETGAPWKDMWRVRAGNIWHAEFSGVPESEQADGNDGGRVAAFFPRGGESLTINATRPEASAGSTLAFDSVELKVDHGARSSTSNLMLEYRSTRGAQHVLKLPDGAEVTEVYIDGELEPLRSDAGELTVPILPGEHDIEVTWRTSDEIGARTETPHVDIGAPAGNIELIAELPANRWLLATNGPRLGPAVLYWPELAALVLFALILGRIDLTPLTTRQWLLLGLGFSTFNWPVLAIVVAWLLACGAREKWRSDLSWWQFDAVQLIIGGATIIALLSIVSALPGGLLGSPDMHVTGYNSSGNSLHWFADSSESVLPTAASWSAPMWVYKALILAWALWLSFALLRWLPWVWSCFSSQGYWRPRKKIQTQQSS